MWPRILELLLGASLLLLPSLLPGAGGVQGWVTWGAGVLVLVFAAGSFIWRFRYAHLGSLVVAAGLLAMGWLQTPRPASPWAQGVLVVGLLLGLTALVPNPALGPPDGWRRYVMEHEEGAQ